MAVKLVETGKVSEINERRLISVCLSNPEMIFDITEKISLDCFWKRETKTIYKSIIDLLNKGISISAENIFPTIAFDIQTTSVLTAIIGCPITDDNEIKDIIAIVIDKKQRRDLHNLVSLISNDLESDEPSEEILNKANLQFNTIGQTVVGGDTLKSVINQIIPDVENLQKIDAADLGFPTGVRKLDSLIRGLGRGQVVTIASRTSEGKTQLGLQSILSTAELGTSCAIFSLEDGKEDITERLICCHSEIDNEKLATRDLNHAEKKSLKSSMESLSTFKIEIDDSASHSTFTIFNKCRKIKHKYGDLGVVLVDYIQCISQKREELEEMMQQFQSYAKSLNCCFLLVSQFSRGLEYRQSEWTEPPRKSDARGSGSIEEMSYKLIYITSEPRQELKNAMDAKTKYSIIWVVKNKRGPLGHVEVINHMNYGKFKGARFNINEINKREKAEESAENFFN